MPRKPWSGRHGDRDQSGRISPRGHADERGDYVVNLLPIGRYSVRVEVGGFRRLLPNSRWWPATARE